MSDYSKIEYNPQIYKTIQIVIPIPDNATNGEVVENLFSEEDVELFRLFMTHKWWNAPYKKERTMSESRCNSCENNTDELSGECYECVKGIQDNYKLKTTNKLLTQEQLKIQELEERVEMLVKEVEELKGNRVVEVALNPLSEEEKKMIVKRVLELKGENK